jgi:epoxyqueuosine reductase
MKQAIIKKAGEIGIDKIGFARADDFSYMLESLEDSKEKGYTSGFEHPVIEERFYPDKLLPQAKTIIAIALAYPTKLKQKPDKT